MGFFDMLKDAWQEAKEKVLWDENSKTCGSCKHFMGMTGKGTCLKDDSKKDAGHYYCDKYEYFGKENSFENVQSYGSSSNNNNDDD